MAEHEDGAKGVSRRKFLHGAGVGAVAVAGAGAISQALAAGTRSEGCKTAGCDYDVVVIGGGFAGVTAARDSRKNGYKTLILEARNRLGGRTFSAEFAGHHVELGGTWIHWTQPFVWAEKERYGLEIKETPNSANPATEQVIVRVGDKPESVSGEQMLEMLSGFDQYFAEGREIWDRPYDAKYTWDKLIARDGMSATDRYKQLKLNPMQRTMVDGYLATMAHCPTEQASYIEVARWWSLPGWNLPIANDSVARYAFKDGTISLINAMIDDGKPDVRLSTPVKKVEDKGDRVIITTQKGEQFVAGSVIIALPMNVLPSVEFSPPLDTKLVEAAKETHSGTGVKLYFKAKGPLPNGQSKISCVADSSYPLNLVVSYANASDHSIYLAFGADPQKLDIQDKDAVQAAMRGFIPDIEVEQCFGYEWVLDPYSRGTYASYRPNWFGKYYDHFEKDRGRILFGQGDHGEGWRGFIDGAIGAGGKAAKRVKELLG